MGKYDPLFHHLSARTENELLMAFADIEAIIGAPLPESARQHQAFWARAKPTDSHVWAHAWQAAGFRANARLESGTVTFIRHLPSLLDQLYPQDRETVMSLVESAGIDVEEWRYSQSGILDEPQSNPNYCYNWSFGSPTEGYVLCVWHEHLSIKDGEVIYRSDIPQLLKTLERELSAGGLTSGQRERLVKHRRRALAFAAAVQASANGAPVQLIINAGDLRALEEGLSKSSRVEERMLDGEDWYVHTLSADEYLLVRGRPRADLMQGEVSYPEPPDDPGEDDAWREGQIRIRRGQAEFRRRLLEVYGGQCIVTGTAMPELLEAAHIIPHSEGKDYTGGNGLLLRADIHTLYDLHLLSIDGGGMVHLSSALEKLPEYKVHKKQLVIPSGGALSTKLASRHARFKAKEAARKG